MSRYHSFEHPLELQEGMVFALETYWRTPDGSSAARIEEEVVVTATGPRLLTRFPADDLLVAGVRYWTGTDVPVPDSLQRTGFSQATQVLGAAQEPVAT